MVVGILGAISGFVAGSSIVMNRFIGPGRIGLQSMTYHPPAPEGAPQAGGQGNMKIDLGNLFSKGPRLVPTHHRGCALCPP